MKKLYIGILAGFTIFIFFLIHQDAFAKNIRKDKVSQNPKSVENVSVSENLDMVILEQKVKDMEKYINECQKYIDASQKNLDLWLKYLTFTFSVLIGYSIFNGLKSREMAKDELKEIKSIKEEIKKGANDAEDRLKNVTSQIIQIENTALNAKSIEEKMAIQLKEFGNKTDLALDNNQERKLDDLIAQTKIELQNNGIEAFKNLYYGKALKASNDENYEETVRLITTYIDLDENNAIAFYMRGRALVYIYDKNNDKTLLEKAMNDYNQSLVIDGKNARTFNNRGSVFQRKNENENALKDFNQAIKLNPKYAIALHNRSLIYKAMGETAKAEKDSEKAKKINPEIGK
jgi:tetratricopeptide (TPR) repeat protein